MLSTHNRADLVSASPATTALDLTLRLAMRLSASMDRALAERGLTITRAGVLFALFEHGPLMQRQLSETLRWTPRYVTSLVDELESGGWARRENHPTDRRATVVTLTRVGVDVAAWMHAERDRTAQELFGQIRPARLKGFIAVARHVLTTIAE